MKSVFAVVLSLVLLLALESLLWLVWAGWRLGVWLLARVIPKPP